MFTELRRRRDENKRTIMKRQKHKKVPNKSYRPGEQSNQTENTLEEFNSRLDDKKNGSVNWRIKKCNSPKQSRKKKKKRN